MECGDTFGVRFDVAQAVAIEEGDVGDTVGQSAAVDGVKAFDFCLVGGDDDLAAFVEGDVMFGSEVGQEGDASAAEGGFQAAGFLVEAGVDDTGVVTGLVGGRVVFFFEERDISGVVAVEDFACHCGADDSCTDGCPSCLLRHASTPSSNVVTPAG